MASNRNLNRNSWILGAAIVLTATSAFIATSESQAADPQSRVNLAANETTAETSWKIVPRSYRPGEAGVRKAAMQGPEALRRYIWRTRMIYDYYYWDFAIKE